MYYQCGECYHDFDNEHDICPRCGAEFSMAALCEECGAAVEDHPQGRCPAREPVSQHGYVE